MKKTVRKAVIAGNWKMNKTRPEAKALLEELKPMVADVKDVEVVACVPFTNLETALAVTAGTNIKIGAENCHFEKSGAFTGEISADMLAEMGVEYVVLGHSERRQYFAGHCADYRDQCFPDCLRADKAGQSHQRSAGAASGRIAARLRQYRRTELQKRGYSAHSAQRVQE